MKFFFFLLLLSTIALGDDLSPADHIKANRGTILTDEQAATLGEFFNAREGDFNELRRAAETFRKRNPEFCEGCFWFEAHGQLAGSSTQPPRSVMATIYELGQFQGEPEAIKKTPTAPEAWLNGAFRPYLKSRVAAYPGYAEQIDRLGYEEAVKLQKALPASPTNHDVKTAIDRLQAEKFNARREALKERLRKDPSVLPVHLAIVDRLSEDEIKDLEKQLGGDLPPGAVLENLSGKWIKAKKDWLKHEVEISPFYRHYYTERRDQKKVLGLLELLAGLENDELFFALDRIAEKKPACVGCYLGAFGGGAEIREYIASKGPGIRQRSNVHSAR